MKFKPNCFKITLLQETPEALILPPIKSLHLESQRAQIEQDFQVYFNTILVKKAEEHYSIPEWNDYYEWYNKPFTLEELYRTLVNYQALEAIFPGLNLKPCQEIIDRNQLH